jgi:hypothetical protein
MSEEAVSHIEQKKETKKQKETTLQKHNRYFEGKRFYVKIIKKLDERTETKRGRNFCEFRRGEYQILLNSTESRRKQSIKKASENFSGLDLP